MANEPFLINPKRRKSLLANRHKTDGTSVARKMQKRKATKLVKNPLGETLMIVGANPISRRGQMLENAWFGHPLEHRRAALKGWRKRRTRKVGGRRKRRTLSAVGRPRRRKAVRRRARQLSLPFTGTMARRFMDNPRRRRGVRRRRRMLDNPRRHRRIRRDNPIALGGSRGIVGSFTRALPLALTGGASIIVTNLAPGFTSRFVGTSDIAKYGTQVATAVVGGMGVGRFIGREHGTVWTVAGLAVIVADLAQKYILGRSLAGLGLGYEMGPSIYGIDAFPEAMSAYPEESVSGFGGLSADPYGQTVGPY